MTEPRPSTIKEGAPELYPVLPLRDIVVFPYMIVPLFVGREKSIAALEEVMRSDKQILLVAQKNASDDEPSTEGLDVFALPEVDMDMLRRRGKEVDDEAARLARLLTPNNPDMAQALADLRAEYKAGSARREGA